MLKKKASQKSSNMLVVNSLTIWKLLLESGVHFLFSALVYVKIIIFTYSLCIH